ncbi:hypothetical protein [Chroococcidiopsis sp.]|uniref:hypothetical protein n=1 Tax=Chroococcidiopsis sp. TaxID=3088168 RepID=UPI003F391DD8
MSLASREQGAGSREQRSKGVGEQLPITHYLLPITKSIMELARFFDDSLPR